MVQTKTYSVSHSSCGGGRSKSQLQGSEMCQQGRYFISLSAVFTSAMLLSRNVSPAPRPAFPDVTTEVTNETSSLQSARDE